MTTIDAARTRQPVAVPTGRRPLRVAHVTTVDLTLRFLVLEQMRRLRDSGCEVAGICSPGEWTEDLRDEGIEYIPWHHATRAWDPLADLRAFVELVGIFRRGRFDVVHTHNPKPGLMGTDRRAPGGCAHRREHGARLLGVARRSTTPAAPRHDARMGRCQVQ